MENGCHHTVVWQRYCRNVTFWACALLCTSKVCGLGVILISLLAFIHFVSIQLADLVKLPRDTVWLAFSQRTVPSVMTWQGESKSALDPFFRDVASTYRCQEVHKVIAERISARL